VGCWNADAQPISAVSERWVVHNRGVYSMAELSGPVRAFPWFPAFGSPGRYLLALPIALGASAVGLWSLAVDPGWVLWSMGMIVVAALWPLLLVVSRACDANGYDAQSGWARRAWVWLLLGGALPQAVRAVRAAE